MRHYLFTIVGNRIQAIEEVNGTPNDLIFVPNRGDAGLYYQRDGNNNIANIYCGAFTQEGATEVVNDFLATE